MPRNDRMAMGKFQLNTFISYSVVAMIMTACQKQVNINLENKSIDNIVRMWHKKNGWITFVNKRLTTDVTSEKYFERTKFLYLLPPLIVLWRCRIFLWKINSACKLNILSRVLPCTNAILLSIWLVLNECKTISKANTEYGKSLQQVWRRILMPSAIRWVTTMSVRLSLFKSPVSSASGILVLEKCIVLWYWNVPFGTPKNILSWLELR